MLPLQHRSRRLAGMLTATLATSALAASPAAAGPAIGPDGGDGVPPEPAPVIVRTVDQGFDVGSAAIGAGGAGALLIVVSLGGLAVASRHHRAPVAH